MSGPLVTAISALATFGNTITSSISGKPLNSYDLSAIPEKLTRDHVPCLIPIVEPSMELSFKTQSYMGSAPQATFSVTHLYLHCESDTPDYQSIAPALMAFIDNYYAALKASPFISSITAPSTHQPARIRMKIGQTSYAGISYHSIEFTHTFVINE